MTERLHHPDLQKPPFAGKGRRGSADKEGKLRLDAMRKIFLILIILFILCLFAGCIGNQVYDAATGAYSSGKSNLDSFHQSQCDQYCKSPGPSNLLNCECTPSPTPTPTK
jgi:hypothetical protein